MRKAMTSFVILGFSGLLTTSLVAIFIHAGPVNLQGLSHAYPYFMAF